MTPFEKDASGKPLRWLKALSIYAIGVELDGILLTLVHNIEFPNASFDEDEVFDEAVQCRFNTIIYELETKFHAIPGTPELPNLNEDWIKTLR